MRKIELKREGADHFAVLTAEQGDGSVVTRPPVKVTLQMALTNAAGAADRREKLLAQADTEQEEYDLWMKLAKELEAAGKAKK
jgi:hypothetical protein